MAAGQVETSKISPIKLYTGNSQQRRAAKGPSVTTYYATRVTEVKDANGNKAFKKEVIKYDNAKGENARVIATQNPGETKLTPNSNATATDRSSLQAGGSIYRATQNQQDTLRSKFGTTADDKSKFDESNGKTNQAISDADNETGDLSFPSAAVGGQFKSEGNTRYKFPDLLKYPDDLADTNQDVIKFQMLRYKPKKFNTKSFGLQDPNRESVTEDQIIGNVILPIVGGIRDTNTVQFGSENMDPVKAELALLSYSTTAQGGEGLTGGVSNLIKKITGNAEDVKGAIAAGFAGAASGTGAQLLTRATGAILNPNTELLFKGPGLRQFNFTFKLSARSEPESQQIIQIIRFFKQGMSPIRTPSNLFLKTPHVFQIQYLHEGKKHPYLNKFKQSALQSFSVDYTPEGNYATFSDGKMVSYTITMQFQELDPVFNDDYGNDATFPTEVGF